MIECETRAPFGVKVERFAGLGYHPSLEVRPGTHKLPELAPGCYDWNKPQRILSKVPRWDRQVEVAEFSRRKGYVGEHIIKREKWFESINGPGWQDPPPQPLNAGIVFSQAVRFPVAKSKSYPVPGPGSYGKHHVPFSRMEEKSPAKGFTFSTLASFDQYSKAPRSLTIQRSYHLPPNLYKLKDSTEEITSKMISKRGPYDLFSVERFPDPVVPKLSALQQRISTSDLSHPKNAFKGIFERCGKDSIITSRLIMTDVSFTKRNPLDPGPNHYNPYPTPAVTQAVAPFNTSVAEVRPVVKYDFSPPPGRYNHEFKKRILGNGMRSAFLSKVSRTLPKPDKMSWFE